MTWIVIIFFIVAVDRTTKNIIVQNIDSGNSITVVDKFFYLTNHDNYGAAWGIFQNGRYFLIVLTIIVSIFMVIFLTKYKNKLLRTSLAIILGGTIGNLMDRIIKGGVTDFLDFHSDTFHFPVFNVADICILAGTLLLIIYMIFMYKGPEKLSAEKNGAVGRKDET